MALPRSSRNGRKAKWVVGHTAEGSRTKESLYDFFNRNQNASSHVGIDGNGIADWVPREYAAWTLLNGNPISVNAELCGFARWTRAQWLSTGWVDGCWNPRAMVRNFALWAKRECEALGIPKRYIGTDGVRRGESGIIMHWDYSKGTGDGDHWDMGYNFPWDVFFADMNEGSSSGPKPAPPVEEEEEDEMYAPFWIEASTVPTARTIPVPASKACVLQVVPSGSDVTVHALYNWGHEGGTGGNPGKVVCSNRGARRFVLPRNTGKVDVEYSSPNGFWVVVDW